MRTGDTIVAISSPPGQSPRGIVRLSGPHAFQLIRALLTADGQEHVNLARRGMNLSRLSLGLPCIVFSYPRPSTYTGEDVAELITTGQPLVLNALIEQFIHAGARYADPGEFTARAYFNGRVSLLEAEGIAAAIAAESDAQLRAAHLLSEGTLSTIAKDLTSEIVRALALVEAGIDFSDEEDVAPISARELLGALHKITASIDALRSRSVGLEQLSSIPRVVICGPANAGKSTLFNALLGRTRAVVHPIPGTTRDVLVEPMHLDPNDSFSPEVALIDLAGFDDSNDELNLQMQRAAQNAIRTADLIVMLTPADRKSSSAGAAGLLDSWKSDAATIHVLSKSDLLDDDRVVHAASPAGSDRPFDHAISTIDGTGLTPLRVIIRDRLGQSQQTLFHAGAVALAPRHDQALREARRHVQAIIDSLDNGQPDREHLREIELIAASLRSALDAISTITGRVTPDDVLDYVFRSFCIGK